MPPEVTRIQKLGIVEAYAVPLSASHTHGGGRGGYRRRRCQSLSSLMLAEDALGPDNPVGGRGKCTDRVEGDDDGDGGRDF